MVIYIKIQLTNKTIEMTVSGNYFYITYYITLNKECHLKCTNLLINYFPINSFLIYAR